MANQFHAHQYSQMGLEESLWKDNHYESVMEYEMFHLIHSEWILLLVNMFLYNLDG